MLNYRSKEMHKFHANTQELNLSELRNKEIIGLFMIGEVSYYEMSEALDLSEQEARDLIEGLAHQLSKNVVRDDSDKSVDVLEPVEEDQ